MKTELSGVKAYPANFKFIQVTEESNSYKHHYHPDVNLNQIRQSIYAAFICIILP